MEQLFTSPISSTAAAAAAQATEHKGDGAISTALSVHHPLLPAMEMAATFRGSRRADPRVLGRISLHLMLWARSLLSALTSAQPEGRWCGDERIMHKPVHHGYRNSLFSLTGSS